MCFKIWNVCSQMSPSSFPSQTFLRAGTIQHTNRDFFSFFFKTRQEKRRKLEMHGEKLRCIACIHWARHCVWLRVKFASPLVPNHTKCVSGQSCRFIVVLTFRWRCTATPFSIAHVAISLHRRQRDLSWKQSESDTPTEKGSRSPKALHAVWVLEHSSSPHITNGPAPVSPFLLCASGPYRLCED